MKRQILCVLLCLLLLVGIRPPSVCLASEEWPSGVSIDADAGILMDADSGAVLYGKNIHSTFPPASITKVLTAIVVLERCSLDDTVTFSHNAVFNVDTNSSSAGYDVGDEVTVRDCLYALLLKSANEVANALAEHVAGTTEEFAVLMNEKAAELGCADSHFSNPSGLNDDNHYVSAYDMALITRAAFENPAFAEIVSTTYYKLPPSKRNPEGQGISPGNKMVKKNWPDQYRSDVIGGKTGFTSDALNTLVIGAQQGDTRLVTVVLHTNGTQYVDTAKLLDFGFKNFESVRIADYDKKYSAISDDLKIAGLPTSNKAILTVDQDSSVILPVTSDFSEVVQTLEYNLPSDAPEGAVARVSYMMGDQFVGDAYLTFSSPAEAAAWTLPDKLLEVKPTAISAASGEGESAARSGEELNGAVSAVRSQVPPQEDHRRNKISVKIPPLFWIILVAAAVIFGGGGGTAYYVVTSRRREEEERRERRERRMERLREAGIPEEEFERMMEKRRTGGLRDHETAADEYDARTDEYEGVFESGYKDRYEDEEI